MWWRVLRAGSLLVYHLLVYHLTLLTGEFVPNTVTWELLKAPVTTLITASVQHMAVPGLTRDNVASHLQKHRMHVKKAKEPRVVDSHNNGNSPCATVSGTDDAQLPVQRCIVV